MYPKVGPPQESLASLATLDSRIVDVTNESPACPRIQLPTTRPEEIPLEDSRSTVESWRGEKRARQHKSSWQFPDRTAQTSGKTPGSEKVARKGLGKLRRRLRDQGRFADQKTARQRRFEKKPAR